LQLIEDINAAARVLQGRLQHFVHQPEIVVTRAARWESARCAAVFAGRIRSVGRRIFFWLLARVFALIFKKGRLREALRASVWSWGWIFVLLVFFLGLAGAVLRSQGGA